MSIEPDDPTEYAWTVDGVTRRICFATRTRAEHYVSALRTYHPPLPARWRLQPCPHIPPSPDRP